MKILFNCFSMEKGGAERVISILANRFIEQNEVTILTLINGELKYELNSNVKLKTIDKGKYLNANKVSKILFKLSPIRITELSKKICEESPDIILSFLPEPSMRLMLIKRFSKKIRKIPTIISVRNDPQIEFKNKVIKFIMKKLYKNVNGMVLQTKDAKKYFEDLFPNKKNMVIIHNPINEIFINKGIYEGERDKTIVTVGRLDTQKNHKLLINAFSKISKKYDNYKLLIYGQGILKDNLEEHIDSLGLQGRAILMGQIDNVCEQIYKAGMFVLSSDYEGMPNSLMEAMALGLPCISTDCPCGGPKELIENEKNGILVEVNNEKQMIDAIEKVIANNDLAKSIGKEASRIRNNHSADNIKDKWLDIINELIKG